MTLKACNIHWILTIYARNEVIKRWIKNDNIHCFIHVIFPIAGFIVPSLRHLQWCYSSWISNRKRINHNRFFLNCGWSSSLPFLNDFLDERWRDFSFSTLLIGSHHHWKRIHVERSWSWKVIQSFESEMQWLEKSEMALDDDELRIYGVRMK